MKQISFWLCSLLLVSCESVYRSYCGCPETEVFQIEDRLGYIKNDTLIYQIPKGSDIALFFPYETAIICNMAVLDSMRLNGSETRVIFSGEIFENCRSQDGDKVDDLIHLHDVVRGPRRLDEH